MQAAVKNATNEASKANINLSSANRNSSLLATNGIHSLKREAIVPSFWKNSRKKPPKNHQSLKMFNEKAGGRRNAPEALYRGKQWSLRLSFRAISGVSMKNPPYFLLHFLVARRGGSRGDQSDHATEVKFQKNAQKVNWEKNSQGVKLRAPHCIEVHSPVSKISSRPRPLNMNTQKAVLRTSFVRFVTQFQRFDWLFRFLLKKFFQDNWGKKAYKKMETPCYNDIVNNTSCFRFLPRRKLCQVRNFTS